MAKKPEGAKPKARTKTTRKAASAAGARPKGKPAKKPAAKRDGRPTKYYPALHLPLAEAWAAVGLTSDQIAAKLGINRATLYRWQKDNPDFCDALKKGKALPDDTVQASLFQRATGYNFKAVKIFMPANASKPVYAPYVEHCPPDVTAQIFWLKNRRPSDWRDRREVDVNQNDLPAIVVEAAE